MKCNQEKRAQNAMLGLAIGDAVSWSALYHRSHLLPFWTRRLRREIDEQDETAGISGQALPFSLNRNGLLFLPSPTDDTEWAAFTARNWLDAGADDAAESLLTAWRGLAAAEESVRGKHSVKAALWNLRKGLLPPVTGHDNPGWFDDAAMCRAVPVGLLHAGRPEAAALAARLDAEVTNYADGIYAAQAIAAAEAAACGGGEAEEAITAALAVLPEASWSAATAALIPAAPGTIPLHSAVMELGERVVNREYNTGCVAVEILAMTLGITRLAGGDFETGIMAANLVAKAADSLPALVGAFTGALSDYPVATPYWLRRLGTLSGICIPSCKGWDYLKLTEELAAMAASSYNSGTPLTEPQ